MQNHILAQTAVSAAMTGDWKKAVETNQLILKENSKDVDALNRLARAMIELGEIAQAKKTIKTVLLIDPYNTIAQKSWEKWKDIKKTDTSPNTFTNVRAFLEEPGKTKIVSLIHLGNPALLAKLDSGDEVSINTTAHRVAITTEKGLNIGKLPDNLSARLKKLINIGNEYKVYVKTSEPKEVKVLIKEIKRSPKAANSPSFTAEKIDYITFTSPGLMSKNNETPPHDFNEFGEEE
jgi:tetratricopeptide (TPR) repeat protein